MTDYILLVEDNPDDELLILRALRGSSGSQRVEVCHDGVEALDYLAGADDLPRLVLMDLHMPRLDGLQTLRHIRADERTCLLPVVMLTASDVQADIAASYDSGANSFVNKPHDYAHFDDVVRQVHAYWLTCNVPAVSS